jgi:transcriptional regulator with XRE-family HTH domain
MVSVNAKGQINPSAAVKIAMIERGLKPAQLAAELGLSRSYIYQLLSGHTVTEKGRERIEAFFGVKFWNEPMNSRLSTGDTNQEIEQVLREFDDCMAAWKQANETLVKIRDLKREGRHQEAEVLEGEAERMEQRARELSAQVKQKRSALLRKTEQEFGLPGGEV